MASLRAAVIASTVLFAVLTKIAYAQDYSCPDTPRIVQTPFPEFPSECLTGPTIGAGESECFPGFTFGFADFIEMDVSAGFSMGIRIDGRVVGWGDFPQGTADVADNYDFLGITGGNTFACGFNSETMQSICWGNGPVVDNNPCLPIFRLDASDAYACALSFNPQNVNITSLTLRSNNCHDMFETAASLSAYCWGQDPETGAFDVAQAGQLVQTVTYDPCVGGRIQDLDPLFGITVGATFACVRTFYGLVGCSGQFSASMPTSAFVQTRPFASIAAGNTHFCGVLLNAADRGKIECHGSGPANLIQNPPSATLLLTDGSIASGDAISCGIRSDNEELICWGAADQFFTKPMPTGVKYKQVVGGTSSQHFCARRKEDSFIDCWGACEGSECDVPTELLAVSCSEVAYIGSGECYNRVPGGGVDGTFLECASHPCSSGTKYELDFGGNCLCGGRDKDRYSFEYSTGGGDHYCSRDTQIALSVISCDPQLQR